MIDITPTSREHYDATDGQQCAKCFNLMTPAWKSNDISSAYPVNYWHGFVAFRWHVVIFGVTSGFMNIFPHILKMFFIGIGSQCQWSYPEGSKLLAKLEHPWRRHQMETFSTLLALCAGNSPVTGEFPSQRPVTRSFDVFIDLRLNIRLSKQSPGWWFQTSSRSLWRHCNDSWHVPQACSAFFTIWSIVAPDPFSLMEVLISVFRADHYLSHLSFSVTEVRCVALLY